MDEIKESPFTAASLNIFQRMSAVTIEMNTVAKNLTVGFGNSKYKAVGEADVLAAVKPLEAKYGIYSYPVSRSVIDSGMIEGEKSNRMFMRIETVYRFVNIDNPTEYIDITTYGDGVDSQDKAPGKAMTYGDKYALLKAYKIQTGDDPDQSASEPMSGFKGGGTISQQKAEAMRQRLSKLESGGRHVDEQALCEKYGVKKLEELNEQQYYALNQLLNKYDK